MKCKTSVRWMWAPVVLATLLSVGCNDEPDSTVRVVPSTDAQIEVDMAPPVVAADMGPPAALEPWHEVRRWYPENPLFCVQGAAENDPFGALLDALRLTEDLGIPRLIYEAYGGYIDADPGRRSWFHRLQRDVLGIPCFSGQAAARADKAVDGDHRRRRRHG